MERVTSFSSIAKKTIQTTTFTLITFGSSLDYQILNCLNDFLELSQYKYKLKSHFYLS